MVRIKVFRCCSPPQARDQSLHSTNKRRYFQYAVRSTQYAAYRVRVARVHVLPKFQIVPIIATSYERGIPRKTSGRRVRNVNVTGVEMCASGRAVPGTSARGDSGSQAPWVATFESPSHRRQSPGRPSCGPCRGRWFAYLGPSSPQLSSEWR